MKIQGNYNNPIKLYQTRTNNNPEWKKHYAGAWKPIQTSYGNVNYEFKIATSLQNKTSSLSVNIYPADKTDVTGIAYESWHFRYVGKEAAKYIMDNHLALEEFVDMLN